MELGKLSFDDLLNQMEYNDGVDIGAIREEIKKRAGDINLSALLGCPFCGNKQIWITEIWTYAPFIYTVECKLCLGTIGTKHKTKEEAITKWNKRAS